MLRKTLFITSICLLALAGACKSAPPSPSATFKTYFEAKQKKDIAGMKRNLSKTSLAVMETSAKEQGVTLDKMIQTQLENSPSRLDKLPETRHENISGDRS